MGQAEILGLLIAGESDPYLARLVKQRGLDFQPPGDFFSRLQDIEGAEIISPGGPLEKAVRAAKVTPGVPDEEEAMVLRRLGRGGQYERQQNFARAEAEYRAALALDGGNAVLHLLLGHLLTNRDPDTAEREYRAAVGLWPQSPVAQGDLASVFEAKADWDAAIAEQRRAIQLDASYPDAHGNLAVALAAKGDWPGAEQEFHRAIDSEPGLWWWRLRLASAQGNHGEVEQAKAACKEVSRMQPDDALLHYETGQVYLALGDGAAAASELREAVRLKRHRALWHVTLGDALPQAGDKPGALKEFQFADDLRPDDPYLHFQIGVAYRRNTAWDEAIDEFRTALRLDTSDELSRQTAIAPGARQADGGTSWYRLSLSGIAHRELGVALGMKKEWDAEIAEQRAALAVNPSDYYAHRELGAALTWQNQWSDALVEYREAIRLFPRYALAHNDAGHALEHQGNGTAALEEYRVAHELAPGNSAFKADYDKLSAPAPPRKKK
jgi:tetratricopeptide (TPR) repeat protein